MSRYLNRVKKLFGSFDRCPRCGSGWVPRVGLIPAHGRVGYLTHLSIRCPECRFQLEHVGNEDLAIGATEWFATLPPPQAKE